MKQFFKEFYGVGILFFYFFKWPFIIGLPILYKQGLQDNYILNILYIYCVFLILKDFYTFYIRAKSKRMDED